MEPNETAAITTSSSDEVPQGIRRARAAFLRDFPALISDRHIRGNYVCYCNDERVAVNSDCLAMIGVVNKLNLPEDAYLIIKVIPGEDRIQQLFADEGDIDLI